MDIGRLVSRGQCVCREDMAAVLLERTYDHRKTRVDSMTSVAFLLFEIFINAFKSLLGMTALNET